VVNRAQAPNSVNLPLLAASCSSSSVLHQPRRQPANSKLQSLPPSLLFRQGGTCICQRRTLQQHSPTPPTHRKSSPLAFLRQDSWPANFLSSPIFWRPQTGSQAVTSTARRKTTRPSGPRATTRPIVVLLLRTCSLSSKSTTTISTATFCSAVPLQRTSQLCPVPALRISNQAAPSAKLCLPKVQSSNDALLQGDCGQRSRCGLSAS